MPTHSEGMGMGRGLARAVLTNGHTGNVPTAPGFFFEGPPTGCGDIIF